MTPHREMSAGRTATLAAPSPQRALYQSDKVKLKVKAQRAATKLVAENADRADEVVQRRALEDRLRKIESALSQSQDAEEEARYAALHDCVTALPNRALFGDRLEHAIEQAARHAWRIAVMFLDLDGFKQVNDTYGHDVGDRVLQEVARRLGDAVRGADSVARRGGDEFLVLAPEIRDDTSMLGLAATIWEHIGEPMQIDGVTIRVGASIGLAIYPEDAGTAFELLKCADVAMYAAKRGQLGVVRFAEPTTACRLTRCDAGELLSRQGAA